MTAETIAAIVTTTVTVASIIVKATEKKSDDIALNKWLLKIRKVLSLIALNSKR